MFKKKKCHSCGEKISGDYNFCPYCGASTSKSSKNEDWGLLGKNDLDFSNSTNIPGINMIFNSLIKNLDKQMRDIEGPQKAKKPKMKKSGISISIHSSGNKNPEIRVKSFGNNEIKKKKTIETKEKIKLPSTKPGKFSGLRKEEPETNIRRFSDKVIYEIKMPGVKSIEDISISQLEDSIEIKALSKNKVFYKVIPINLPIKKYDFSEKKLTLELDSE